MIAIDGLITGIDTETIIEGLLDIQKTQIDRLGIRRRDIEAKQAAYDSLEVQLASFNTIADQLSRPQSNVFGARGVTVSDESALFAVAKTDASIGTYQIHVDALARAHQVASAGFSDADAEITLGTLDIQVGDGDLKTVTIDAENSTIQGLANSINSADAGVSATLVNDGSTGGRPYRLLLTAEKTGADNEIVITNNLAASGGTAVQPTFDFGNPVQAATDSQVRLGSGPGALTVQNETNEINDLIQGVTLDLLAADVNQEIQIRVGQNTEPATTAVNDLVDTYNSIVTFIDDLVRFNPDTDQAGLLIGDRAITDIQNDIRSAVLDVVPGLDGDSNRLSVLGISINNQGKLTVNATRLEEVLSGRVEEITQSDLKELFAQNHTNADLNAPAGIGTRLGRIIDRLIDVENGGLTSALVGLNVQFISIVASIDRKKALFYIKQ